MTGQYIRVELPGGTAQAYLTGAAGPGVLLFMDAIGLRPQIETMADRIASWGYVVLAPNTFWREGDVAALAPGGDLRVPANREAFMASGASDRVGRLTPEQIEADVPAWINALRSAPGTYPGALAAVGYCFGGRLALRAAALEPGQFEVVGMFHTGGIVTDGADSPHLLVPKVRAFVLAGHADNDRSNTPVQIAAFDEALDAEGVPHRTTIYPNALHGYTMADTSSYQEQGGERHFAELREVLADRLPPTAGG